jgi:methylenetetrahydrofolate--tRNA-(uracil-5-)-methyltransferase
MARVIIIGGGLAGSDCAWQLAGAGVAVDLYEMKPGKRSEAHTEDGLAELVCSNSFRATGPAAAIGLLKDEMASLGSLIMEAAFATKVPAGGALAVDRALFSEYVTRKIEDHPNITVIREEIPDLDAEVLAGADAVVIAAGPLASPSLTASLIAAVGDERLYFYDAIAPIVSRDSVDFDKAFWGSRWKPEDDDYLNCPMTEDEYMAFVAALMAGQKVQPRDFEKEVHFEGCLPVEAMAERGEMTLAFGPLKPVGLVDPKTGERPFAVVQLRTENADKTAFNLVGFQTKLKYPEQKRVFRMIPGLENAEFLRLGSIHRNTYVNAPDVLDADLQLKVRPGFYLAGQITGVEGYLESAACGLWVGLSLAKRLSGGFVLKPPAETAMGALLGHLSTVPDKRFQPSNVNFGLMPGLKQKMKKKFRKEAYGVRAQEAFAAWLDAAGLRA